jgi:hypothetical protein
MLKNSSKIPKYSIFTLTFCLLTFLYFVYIGENRISLMLNQGTSVPSNLDNITIKARRGLGVLINSGGYSTSICKTSKQSLNKWLKTSNFAVIHFPQDSFKPKSFYTNYDSLPAEIIKSKINYIVQFKRHKDYLMLFVTPVDSQNVLLRYEMDWD